MSMSEMNVLVADVGSGSLHFQVLGPDDAILASTDAGPDDAASTIAGLHAKSPAIAGVAHRLVVGGPGFTRAVVIDDRVRGELAEAARRAPLHVPPALRVLDAARAVLPDVPQIACFDSAFHATLPEAAYVYALPAQWREQFGVRRYGYHGLSYAWALRRAAAMLGRSADSMQLVLAHLGGGCSAAAVSRGRSVDTTMGFTPLEGLVMSHRSGSVDPGLLLWLETEHGLDADAITEALNHRSGLAGLSGLSDDTRELVRARAAGSAGAALALSVFVHHARRGIAAMAASLDRVDALVLTGEIGEDQPELRQEICTGLGVLGISGDLDSGHRSGDALVSSPGAQVPVLVVAPGEVAQMAREAREVLSRQGIG
jgi:acetate kinase